VGAVMQHLEAGDQAAAIPAARALGDYLNSLDEACYHLKNRMANLALREDLVPWIEALEGWIWLGKRSVLALEALEQGKSTASLMRWIEDSLKEIHGHNKRSGGSALRPLANYVRERAGGVLSM
jgi:hyaluronoglucosaminidase